MSATKMQGKRQNPVYQAQAIISRRDHSVYEVATKLRRRGFGEDEIALAITKLRQAGLLNDQKFAAAYIASILQTKPVGPRWLKSKLTQKGIAGAIINQELQKEFSGNREQELAKAAAQSWQRSHPRHANDGKRLVRFLASRGFSQAAYSFFDWRMSGE